MNPREYEILLVAGLVREAAAMGDAALTSDINEARFRAQLIATQANEAGYIDVALEATRLLSLLGPVGTAPSPGYGAAMLRMADALDALGFDPT
jgi:hypothetical protein